MSEMPRGWEEALLEDLLISLESGARPKGGVRGISDGIPSIGGEHLTYSGTFDFASVKYVPEEFYARMAKGHIQETDILIVKDGATTGKTAYVDNHFPFDNAVVNEHVFICRPSNMVEARFLFRYLTSQEGQQRVLENFKGSAQGGINQSFASNTAIPVAPLNEQRRIVAKLDSLLAKVDACQHRLAKFPRLLRRFRQAVLAAACSGRLTADWRENKVEVDSLNSDSFVEPICEIPATWTWTTLNSICDSTRGISYGVIKLGNEVADGVPCLRTSDVKPLRIDSTNVKRISKEISSGYQRTVLNGGEVLVNVRGTLGGVAVVSSEMKGWNISREVALVPVRSSFEPKFISFWIASQYSQNWLAGVEKGAAYTGINLEDLRLLPVAIPSLPEQLEIVRRVEAFFHLADQLEARYHKAKAYVDKLTQSLLAKAFRGELVPQDPADEPAAVLLERIRAERANRNESQHKRRKAKS